MKYKRKDGNEVPDERDHSEIEDLLLDISNKLSQPKEVRFFGFRLQELIILLGMLFSVYGFYLRTDDAMKRLVASTDWLMDFSKNSDSYHSASLGTEFEQGRPKNPGFDIRPIRGTPSVS